MDQLGIWRVHLQAAKATDLGDGAARYGVRSAALPASLPKRGSVEVDFTNTNFFRNRSKLNIAENLYWAIQDADVPGKAWVLFGANVHILSRGDNLNSGNLPTIDGSLI